MGPNDPLRVVPGAANMGAGALHRGGDPAWDLADVVAYNSATHTAVVRTHRGRPLQDVPQIRMGAGDFEHLKIGTTVVVTWDLGFPAILGCMSRPGEAQQVVRAPSITGVANVGDSSPTDPTHGTNNFKPPNAPTDLTAGDWAKVGTHGNFFALLEGGVTLMGSPAAQIRSIGIMGILQVLAQQLQTFTDFGEWRTQNDQGRTSFILRAGTNQATQTGLGEEHWTIRLDLGATGDLFNFQITEPTGRNLFRFHVGPDGRVEIYGDGGVDVSSGKNANAETLQDIAGARNVNVGEADNLVVAGPRKVRVGGRSEENITGDKATVVGAAETHIVNSDRASSVGGQHVDIVTGGTPLDAKKGRPARTTKLVNGGWLIDIGKPTDGANITAQAAFELTTHTGDLKLTAGWPYTIQLNGDEQHVLRGNELRDILNNFIEAYNNLVNAYNTHLHPTGTGPSGTPLPNGVPPVPNPYVVQPGPPSSPPSPWFGMAYVADDASINSSRTSPFPLPPQPKALAIVPFSKIPESVLSERVLVK